MKLTLSLPSQLSVAAPLLGTSLSYTNIHFSTSFEPGSQEALIGLELAR